MVKEIKGRVGGSRGYERSKPTKVLKSRVQWSILLPLFIWHSSLSLYKLLTDPVMGLPGPGLDRVVSDNLAD